MLLGQSFEKTISSTDRASFEKFAIRVKGQPIQPAFEVFQHTWGRRPNPPAITMVFVSGLANPDFLVEMDAIALVPQ
jgi:enamine deaminase RidA (YjgF/YER057c/UK114 family)